MFYHCKTVKDAIKIALGMVTDAHRGGGYIFILAGAAPFTSNRYSNITKIQRTFVICSCTG
jgi:hypothetical protein